MKKRFKATIACITLFVMLPFMMTPASAMTPLPPKSFSGRDALGVVSTALESEVVVENETLTFNITDFPKSNYESQEDFLSYSSTVNIKYTLYNPTNEEITLTLAYPFGNYIEYADQVWSVDTSKYSISVNDNTVSPEIYHTYCSIYNEIDYPKQFEMLTKDYITDGFLAPDTVVTKYTFKSSGVGTTLYGAVAGVALDVDPDEYPNSLFFLDRYTLPRELKNGNIRLCCYYEEENNTYDLYVIGEPLKEMPEWRFYENAFALDADEISGRMTIVKTETMTLTEFADTKPNEALGFSQVDRYNTLISEIQSETALRPVVQLHTFLGELDCYMRWYKYDVTIPAGERITTAVTAPAYPNIEENYIPPVYNYNAWLTTSTTWTTSGSLDVIINTPYYMTYSTDEYTKTDFGYSLHHDSLTTVIDENTSATMNAIHFELCSEENPEREKGKNVGLVVFIILVAIILLPLTIIAAAIQLIVDGVKAVIEKVKHK